MAEILQARDGTPGGRHVAVPARALVAAAEQWPMLRQLAATGAGYAAGAANPRGRTIARSQGALFIYCLRGGGSCRVAGRLHPIRPGDLAVLDATTAQDYGARPSDPWTIHWVRAEGDALPVYLRALGTDARSPVVRLGEDLQAIAMFNELRRDLGHGATPLDLFHAAQTLGHLLSVLIRCHSRRLPGTAESLGKVAQVIDYLSEHHHEPLNVPALAALVNLSPDHFTALFKHQTGCAPYAYLQLLRMHRAAEWLARTTTPVKEIAHRLGYSDPFHFSRQFKRVNGVSPSQFRSHHPGFVHAKPGSIHGS